MSRVHALLIPGPFGIWILMSCPWTKGRYDEPGPRSVIPGAFRHLDSLMSCPGKVGGTIAGAVAGSMLHLTSINPVDLGMFRLRAC